MSNFAGICALEALQIYICTVLYTIFAREQINLSEQQKYHLVQMAQAFIWTEVWKEATELNTMATKRAHSEC